ncbi:MAG: hypothetical protein L0Y72_30090 [Gemmataceae bacterium]|nr:hypothetical protein [Gemmataceae bacterium]
MDDYGEVWVDGRINNGRGRGAIAGFNTRNRVRLGKYEIIEEKGKKKEIQLDAKPGEVFQIAVLGINGPIGNPPGNKIFMHGFINLEFFTKDAKNGGADVPAVVTPPEGKVIAKIDLLTQDGAELVQGEWRRHLVTFHTSEKKNGIEPRAHGAFDDSEWDVVAPEELKKAFGPRNFSMAWHRIKVTLPEKVGDVDVTGAEAWFRTTVDDYAEIWINSAIVLSYGESGRGAIAGFNQPNEVLLSRNAQGGQKLVIAVLAMNGPFGNPPPNGIFFRPTEIRYYKK